jgi:hypothetical protein
MTDESQQTRQVAEAEHPFAGAISSAMPTALALYLNDALFERVSQIAARLAKAQGITPKHLIGQPEACFAVVSRAITWRLDPFAVAGATYQTPGGQVGYEGKLVLAILENSGRLEAGGVKFEHYGDWSHVQGKFEIRASRNDDTKKYAAATWTDDDARKGRPDAAVYPLAQSCGVRVSARIRGEHEPRQMDFDLIQAQPRNSTLWATDPKTQICYTAARRFANAVVPALMMGVPFEPIDNFGTIIDITPASVIPLPSARKPAEDSTGAKPASPGTETTSMAEPAAATAEKAQQTAQNDASATQTGGEAGKDPAPAGGAAGTLFDAPAGGKTDAPAMKTKASPAQRKMIADMAQRKGFTIAQLDEKLVERFAFGIDEMPAVMVNDVAQLVATLAAPAKRA